ncbi:uncharacterized protein LOC122258579 [Penaeus japonicus]|uniref:uncharacterized protein LOC122258579 n=1 Tax=Penaeus japonicus TaxID=27405 RepID=UPI001C71764F|nr:uncharacterized protein LOC122258579 [Penaeus japonicus]
MAARLKQGGHESFLNKLLLLREQEVLNLSKKLHNQAALDSDVSSGISEGSLGSPESRALSLSPPPASSPDQSADPRLHSPTSDKAESLASPRPHHDPLDDPGAQEAGREDDHYALPQPHIQLRNDLLRPGVQDETHDPYGLLSEDDDERRLQRQRLEHEDHHPLSRQLDFDQERRLDDLGLEQGRRSLSEQLLERYDQLRRRPEDHWSPDGLQNDQDLSRGESVSEDEGDSQGDMNSSSFQHQQQMALAARAVLGSLTSPSLAPAMLPFPPVTPEKQLLNSGSNLLVRALATSAPRRPRGEKKPIPDTLKDDKYYERRKRNNLAAKKSRDARKQREDQVAMRASYLEKENAILRAQVATLRDEASSLRHLLLQKKTKQQ